MVLAQSQFVATAPRSGSGGTIPSSILSRRWTNSAAIVLYLSSSAGPKRRGNSTVARITSAATGLRSFAIVSHPSRTASNGTLPPPAVGSRTTAALPLQTERSHSASAGEGWYVNDLGYV